MYTPMTNSWGERVDSGAEQFAHDITAGYAHTFRAALPARRQRRPIRFPSVFRGSSIYTGPSPGKLVVDALIKRASG